MFMKFVGANVSNSNYARYTVFIEVWHTDFLLNQILIYVDRKTKYIFF